MKAKVYAIMVAALIAVAGVIVYTSQSDADGINDPVTNGKMTVNISYGENWESPMTVDAYNGAIALDRALGTATTHVIDMNLYTQSGQYVSINYQYGEITSINNIAASGNDVWNVYILNASGSWVSATDTLGWYKPFGDYDVDHQTANIAVIYGTSSEAQTLINSFTPTVTSTIVPVSDIVGNEYFKATFYIKVDQSLKVQTAIADAYQSLDTTGLTITDDLVNRGVYVFGYGSDLYLALKNALNTANITHVSGVDSVPYQNNGAYTTIYSWINEILGLSTVYVSAGDDPISYDDDEWAWWQQYAEYSVSSTGVVSGDSSDFSLGLYSTIDDAPLTTYSYALFFTIGGM